MPGQVKLAGINLLCVSEPHGAIIETEWKAVTYGILPERMPVPVIEPITIKIAALWCRPDGHPRMHLRAIEGDGGYIYSDKPPLSYDNPLLDAFYVILKRADQERWKFKRGNERDTENKQRYQLIKYLIILISKVFPVPLDSQYQEAAYQKCQAGGDFDALQALIYFLENKIEIKNSFGARSTIVQLDSNFRTIMQVIPNLDRDLQVFRISGSTFTGTMFGTTVSLKPDTLEALIKKLLIAAHELNNRITEVERFISLPL